jgi:hypothetical protein
MISRLGIASTAMGTATVVASVTWFAMGSTPQPAVDANGPSGEQASGALVVCSGQDGILRAFRPSPGCPAGQTLMPLIPESGDDGGLDILDFGDEPKPKKGPRFKDDALADLEQRIANLKKSPLFTVVDKEGNRLFQVAPHEVRVYNGRGKSVARIAATQDGGLFGTRSADSKLYAFAGVSLMRAGIRLQEDEALRLDLGRQVAGNFSLKVSSDTSSGDPIAGIGESMAGTGAMVVADDNARVRASMRLMDGRGEIGIFNEDATSIASFREAINGAGLLAIGDAKGREAVKMDTNDSKYGAVIAGPQLGLPLVTGSGLPGSYFFGCAGGDACRPY